MTDIFPGWRTAGHAMRWARGHHGGNLAVHVHRYTDGRRRYSWTLHGTDAVLSIQTDPDGQTVHVYAADLPFQLRIDTADTDRVLDVLVALGVLPRAHSGVFQRGRLAGRVDLARELTDARTTYDLVEQAGRDAWKQVMNR